MEALLPYYLERKSKEEASAHEELCNYTYFVSD